MHIYVVINYGNTFESVEIMDINMKLVDYSVLPLPSGCIICW